MSKPLEDYAILGDTHTTALVGLDGSIDWLCVPRFNSEACFAALLGDERHGRWLLAPEDTSAPRERRYRLGTLVLETVIRTNTGSVRIVDAMDPHSSHPRIVRLVEGLSGTVPMRLELAPRFTYGRARPWVRREGRQTTFLAGPDALSFDSHVAVCVEAATARANFSVSANDRIPFILDYFPSHEKPTPPVDPFRAIEDTDRFWSSWSAQCSYKGDFEPDVVSSLVVLKALTFSLSGGIVAAPTASLPEVIGGSRNWDYRYCWLRDATFTLLGLMRAGYTEEAMAFRDWLLRAVAGDPSDLQIMYGPLGERLILEHTIDWLPGYEGSRPVRIGNAAVDQLQLDVYGEVIDCLYQARRAGLPSDAASWSLEMALLDFLEDAFRQPDQGIWEMRGPARPFTHSKVMVWVAMDRAIRQIERLGASGPLDRLRSVRSAIHEEVCRLGFDSEKNSFVQAYGSNAVDASLLLIPLVGFLPPDDPRVIGTVAAVQRELCDDGLIRRYVPGADGLPGREGTFLACSFWLADNLCLQGRVDEARTLFLRLLSLRNDVGLLSEQYDTQARRLVGNFPQAFSHVALINTAQNLALKHGPAYLRSERHLP